MKRSNFLKSLALALIPIPSLAKGTYLMVGGGSKREQINGEILEADGWKFKAVDLDTSIYKKQVTTLTTTYIKEDITLYTRHEENKLKAVCMGKDHRFIIMNSTHYSEAHDYNLTIDYVRNCEQKLMKDE